MSTIVIMQMMRAPLSNPTVVSQSIIVDVILDSGPLDNLSIILICMPVGLGKCRPPSYEQEMNYNSRLYLHNQRWEILIEVLMLDLYHRAMITQI